MIYGAQSLAAKILMSNNLQAEILTKKDPKRDDVASAHRHGLGHHRAIEAERARLDVTRRMWKFISASKFAAHSGYKADFICKAESARLKEAA
jgi:hypothetical protein